MEGGGGGGGGCNKFNKGGCQNKRGEGVGISTNLLISVMNEKIDMNV